MYMNLSSIMKSVCLVGTEHHPIKTEDRIVENREDQNNFGHKLWNTKLSEERNDRTEETTKGASNTLQIDFIGEPVESLSLPVAPVDGSMEGNPDAPPSPISSLS